MKVCATCSGTGTIRETKRTFFGAFTTTAECRVCYGTGQVPETPCTTCGGAGVVKKDTEIKIKIPAGIRNGEVIRLAGAGEAVPKGVAGDLYVKIHVLPHKVFKREGNNLVMTLDVKLTDALLGSEYTIQTIDGKTLKLKIPKGASFGEVLRIRGKGVPDASGKRGDLLVTLNIVVPRKLSRKAEKLIKELREEGV